MSVADHPPDASPGDRNAGSSTFDPDDPLAGIRKVEHVDADKRVGEVAKAVRAMAAAGVLETRMLSLSADDSRAQTTAVLKAIANGKKRSGTDFSDWHALDHWIRHANHDVAVPYAGWLAANIPPVAVRLRRDFATLLALVETHAIIHQLDREINEHGRIVATSDDTSRCASLSPT